MSERVYLKLRDKTILEFNTHEGYYNILHPELLPFILRDRMAPANPQNPDYATSMKNQEALLDFFSNRSLSIKRENAKSILNAMNISQKNSYETKYKIMVLCKGLSVSDDYWITNNLKDRWADVNLRDNPLHETVAQIALFGKSLTITGQIRTPELTGQGAYAKAWFRENGELYLYKASTKGGREAEVEASVSSILDCTNVPHVAYELTQKDGRIVTRCRNMCSEQMSIVDADDVASWCARTDTDFDKLVRDVDGNLFFQTIVTDYLIANRDRHGANWGFFMSNDTGRIADIHPLFDHNNAFAEEFMDDPDGGICQLLPGKTQREAASCAIKRCDFRITKEITEDLFPDEKSYRCFMERGCELGLFQSQKPSLLQKLGLRPYQEYIAVEIKPDNRKDYEDRIAAAAADVKFEDRRQVPEEKPDNTEDAGNLTDDVEYMETVEPEGTTTGTTTDGTEDEELEL